VLAIEPDSESRLYLQKTLAGNAAAQISPLAAADRPGTLTLYKNPENKGDNRLYPDPLLRVEEKVGADTLDNICRGYGITSAQFIKIDVQGAEAQVMRGAGGLLAASRDCILMTEFWPYGLAHCGSDALGYLDLLRDLGFQLCELSGNELAPVSDPRALVERTQGRRYANLVGIKGNPATAR
jgi:FkbM family methyltransferase